MRWQARLATAIIVALAVVATACTSDRAALSPVEQPPAEQPPATGQPTSPSRSPRRTAATSVSTSTVAPTVTPTPLTTVVAPTTIPAPKVSAQAYAVLDATSGTLLAAREGDERRSVGSLMKLLTAYVSYQAGRPGKIVTAPEELLISVDESAIGIYPGEQLRRDVLIRALLIVSANDAARALAADIAGSEDAFAEQMTNAARSLGLADTRAANATGLDAEGQYSSANDMVALGAMMMQDRTFRRTVARHDATLHDALLPATNDWLEVYAGANGIKTGHTTGAGWCILASAERGGRRIVTAVLGAPGEPARNAAATALIDWAFAN